jgi:hypothetical protein
MVRIILAAVFGYPVGWIGFAIGNAVMLSIGGTHTMEAFAPQYLAYLMTGEVRQWRLLFVPAIAAAALSQTPYAFQLISALAVGFLEGIAVGNLTYIR